MTGIPEAIPAFLSCTRTARDKESSVVQEMSETWMRLGSSFEPAPIDEITWNSKLDKSNNSTTVLTFIPFAWQYFNKSTFVVILSMASNASLVSGRHLSMRIAHQ